jgi:hypothetical protein
MVADGGIFLPKTFPETEVEGVMGLADDKSALVLRSGVKIPVALSYEQLEQKIYQPDFKNDDPVLDLRNVTGKAAKPKAPANTNQAPAPGDKMPDGTVFAGISPDTNKPMYAPPTDASLTMKFNEAQEYATKLDAHGHKDWRVPTKAELNVLFNNRAAIGGYCMRPTEAEKGQTPAPGLARRRSACATSDRQLLGLKAVKAYNAGL